MGNNRYSLGHRLREYYNVDNLSSCPHPINNFLPLIHILILAVYKIQMLYYHISKNTIPVGFSKCFAFSERIRFSRRLVEEFQNTRKSLTPYWIGNTIIMKGNTNDKNVYSNN